MKQLTHKTTARKQALPKFGYCATALLCLLAILVYVNVFKNDFVGYDDQNLIQNNVAIRSLSLPNVARMFVPKLRGNYQPVRTLSYAVDCAIWGPKPFGFQLTNIILHALAVIGVWLVLRELLPKPVPFLSAMIFAVLPIHVESVTWMSARKDGLSLLFFLLAIVLYERSESNRKVIPYLGSIFATALSLLSKLTTVTLPLCIVLVEICRDGWPKRNEWARKLTRLTPHIFLVCLVIGLNFVQIGAAPSHGDALAPLEDSSSLLAHDVRLSMPLVICRYIGLLFLPYHLSTHYDVAQVTQIADFRFLIPLGFLAAIAILGIICFLRGHRAIAFCIGWFIVTFLPTSNLLPTAALMVDRYMHVPSIGFAALLAIVLLYPLEKTAGDNPSARRLMLLPAILTLLLFSVLTIRRNADWRTTTSLFTRTLFVNPRSVDARLALGAMYQKDGDYSLAVEMYREALDIVPRNYRVLYNLGVAYMKMGRLRQAMENLEQSRSANPIFLATHFNLALAYHQQGRYQDAIAEHREVLRLDPAYSPSHGDLGRIYLEIGETGPALEELNQALNISPDLGPALADRAGIFIQQGRYAEAEQDLARLASLGVDTRHLRATLRNAQGTAPAKPSS